MLMGVWWQSLLQGLSCPCISALSCWHFVNFLFRLPWKLKPHKNSSLNIAFFRFAIKLHRSLKGLTVQSCFLWFLLALIKHCKKKKKSWKCIVRCVRTGGFYSLRLFCFSSDFIRTTCPLGPWVVDWLQILSVDKLSISLNCVHGCINTHFIILWQGLWHNICLHQRKTFLPSWVAVLSVSINSKVLYKVCKTLLLLNKQNNYWIKKCVLMCYFTHFSLFCLLPTNCLFSSNIHWDSFSVTYLWCIRDCSVASLAFHPCQS